MRLVFILLLNSILIDELNKSDRLVVTEEDSVVAVIDAVTQDNSEIGLVLDEDFTEDLKSNTSAN